MPADHGPIAVYWIPRQAIAARTASDSNDSATKSAMAIGRTRVIVRPSCRPRPRNVRPSRNPGEGVAEPRRFDVRGRLPGDLAEEPRERADQAVERRISSGIRGGASPQALRGPGSVAP